MSDSIYSYEYTLQPLKKPTRLIIVYDPVSGLKYFCKTVRVGNRFEQYFGSGTKWSNITKKHKDKLVKLWVSDFFYDTSIVKFAMRFSRFNRIVESEEWANLIPENGLDGGGGDNSQYWTEESHRKVSERAKKQWEDPEFRNFKSKHSTKILKVRQNRPWKNLNTNEKSLEVWRMLDKIYDICLELGTFEKVGEKRKRGSGYTAISKVLSIEPSKSMKNAINYLEENGDPKLDEEWVNFVKEA